ncbi:MAG: polymer-forming cytoskeletal protein [Phycisphaerae bacterium]|nr:polymer-forming cytoskeletal protein [Gemmatimonadaceae bacterium]
MTPIFPDPTEPRANSMTAGITPIRDLDSRRKESVITEELTIEGKIEGSGNVRIAGKFKGEVNVQGNLVIEQGATVTANVRALTITIAGQLEGNIEGATRVELLETGVLTGDVVADSLTVAAGSRMRGQADFGWTDKKTRTP